MEPEVFKKAEIIYKLVGDEIGVDREEFNRIIAKLVNGFHNKRKGKAILSRNEAKTYELLIRKKYNPNTVYRWILAVNSPQDILIRLKSGEISIREALQLRNKIRQQYSTNDEKLIQEVLWYVGEYVL
ncbi:hypothetical protein K9M79_06375 [Candidatus Woesearchaeota archaeon]|nr:hypothetical protein [Candidatus Woesearchaeota archaeon]